MNRPSGRHGRGAPSSRLPVSARLVDTIVDRGLVGDRVARRAIRGLLRRRLAATTAGDVAARAERKRRLLTELSGGAVATGTDAANEQHYEEPTELFELMLGPHLKYSSGYWPPGVTALADAEEAMLELTCARAQLLDGQEVLELGCGWGSLTLWMAQRFPSSRIVAVSNSTTQREFIAKRAAERDLTNVTVVPADVNDLGRVDRDGTVGPARFDRVVSVELFEHVRNHRELTARIASWLRPGGKLFVHVFAHASDPYAFETGARGDWMARHFFTGGIMPSDDLLLHAVSGLDLDDHWVVSGTHYARTIAAWLERLDAQHERIVALLDGAHGRGSGRAAYHRWRVFCLACEQLFAYHGGDEWHVSHYRFVRPS